MGQAFDPAAPAAPSSGLFGLDVSGEEAGVHVLPVPFDATTSYRPGAAAAPEAILRASHQVDLFDLVTGRPYEAGIRMAPADPRIASWNEEARACVERVHAGEAREGDVARVDAIQDELAALVRSEVDALLGRGKLVGVLGGDHSTPLGAIEACAARHPGVGLLHVDAHADLRPAYEGFAQSHASILHNVVERAEGLGPIVQVGLRDLAEEELEAIRRSEGRIQALFDPEWAGVRLTGGDLRALVRRTLGGLPAEVWVTFDVDGLDPTLCPNTGTPVPGGFTWHEAMLWLAELVRSGRRIVGFDLTEVAPAAGARAISTGPDATLPGPDEIVGARLLYRLIGFALLTRGTPP